jgi:putative phosphoesterase
MTHVARISLGMKHWGTVRIALISDIHANLPALDVVMNDPEFNECERVLFAGDLVGYYYWPLECYQSLEGLNCDAIRGNHEDMLLEAIDNPAGTPVVSKYGSGLKVAIEELPADAIANITQWDHPKLLSLSGKNILMCHGSPSDISQYLYPNVDLPESVSFDGSDAEIVVHGHTHYPSVRQSNGVLWINPGSVGQPRNKQPGAHWAMLDTESLKVSSKISPYDYSSVVDLAKQRDPNHSYLWEVLQRT